MAWYSNQGFNHNLMVQLSGGGVLYQIDVYVVARFRFFYAEGAVNWTSDEAEAWKRRFAQMVYSTWSEQHLLLSAVDCLAVTDVPAGSLPTARVRVHVVDDQAPSVRLLRGQHLVAIDVFRRAPGDPVMRQHADALLTSSATVGIRADGELPSGTARAQLYEDSLEPGAPSDIDGTIQVVAMHEFGHMLGYMHPNDMEPGCVVDRSHHSCYGDPYSTESRSIMGRGQVVRPADYLVFAEIMSRRVTRLSDSGLRGAIGFTRRLHWFVAGSADSFCAGGPGRVSLSTAPSAHSRGGWRRQSPTRIG